MNIRDKFIMWRPKIDNKGLLDKPNPSWDSSASENSISSSTSSDSDEVSEDDMLTMAEIRGDLVTADEKDQEDEMELESEMIGSPEKKAEEPKLVGKLEVM